MYCNYTENNTKEGFWKLLSQILAIMGKKINTVANTNIKHIYIFPPKQVHTLLSKTLVDISTEFLL